MSGRIRCAGTIKAGVLSQRLGSKKKATPSQEQPSVHLLNKSKSIFCLSCLVSLQQLILYV